MALILGKQITTTVHQNVSGTSDSIGGSFAGGTNLTFSWN